MNAKRCPTLKELPKPPQGKTGWPWTEESPQLPDTMPDGNTWPKISIVTPSLNQGQFIEETIRSVLLQGYPNLEYIIIDGGSTDETLNIIKKYEPWITHWISEPDRGQANALNKGFARATGEIFAYINSDDLYEKDAFFNMARQYVIKGRPALITGACLVFDELGKTRIFSPTWPSDLSYFLKPFGSPFAQPASFWKADVYRQVGGFNEKLHYAFDREFFLKLGLKGIQPFLTATIVARYRDHQKAKTRSTINFFEEAAPIIKKYGRACGLSDTFIRRRIRKVHNNIAYLRTFTTWKYKGRKAATAHFIWQMLAAPDFLLDRKVLGLARRLLMFRTSDVAEIQN